MAVDEDAAQTHLAHLAESDLHRPAVGVRGRMAYIAWHRAIEARRPRESNYQSLGIGTRENYCASWVWKANRKARPLEPDDASPKA